MVPAPNLYGLEKPEAKQFFPHVMGICPVQGRDTQVLRRLSILFAIVDKQNTFCFHLSRFNRLAIDSTIRLRDSDIGGEDHGAVEVLMCPRAFHHD